MFDVVCVPESVGAHQDLVDDYGFVATTVPYEELLVQAGFKDIGVDDTTAGYLEVAGRWLDAVRDLKPDLRNAMGDAAFDDKLSSRVESYKMIDAGELGRTLYWATKPRDQRG